MGRWPAFLSHMASLPEEVVLPPPCRPAIRMTLGGCDEVRKRAVSRPRILMSSSWTILTICSSGESAVATWEPSARVRMWSTTSVTTAKLTSDSMRARRISRRASAMFSSVMVPWPRRVLKERWSLSLRVSNMLLRVYQRDGGRLSPGGMGLKTRVMSTFWSGSRWRFRPAFRPSLRHWGFSPRKRVGYVPS